MQWCVSSAVQLVNECLKCSQTPTRHQTDSRDGGCHAVWFAMDVVFYVLHHAHRRLSVYLLQKLRCTHGCSGAIFLANLISWLNGKPMHIHLYTDSSGARRILQRMGVGRLRHLSCRILWLQQLIAHGPFALQQFLETPIQQTKRVGCSRMRSLMSALGIFNLSVQSLEGSDAPGGVCAQVQHPHVDKRLEPTATSRMQLRWTR